MPDRQPPIPATGLTRHAEAAVPRPHRKKVEPVKAPPARPAVTPKPAAAAHHAGAPKAETPTHAAAPTAVPNIVLEFGENMRLVYTYQGNGTWAVWNEAFEETSPGHDAALTGIAAAAGYWHIVIPPLDQFNYPYPFEGEAEVPTFVADMEETRKPRGLNG